MALVATCGQFDLVTVNDQNGQHVVRYLKLCDGRFFGGNTWDRVDGFAGGIHEMLTLDGILGLIARIANTPGPPYELGSMRAFTIPIRREMNARQIADILGCDEQSVRSYFEPVISLLSSCLPARAQGGFSESRAPDVRAYVCPPWKIAPFTRPGAQWRLVKR